MSDVLALVEARLLTALGEPDARAAITFLGTDRIEVLRFLDSDDAGDIVRYATLGMSAHPMTDPTA
ncbi:suppressor of fused domain protein, partial [Streptomyces sp. UNOB3_S3]